VLGFVFIHKLCVREEMTNIASKGSNECPQTAIQIGAKLLNLSRGARILRFGKWSQRFLA
jgi:hypothetical protein